MVVSDANKRMQTTTATTPATPATISAYFRMMFSQSGYHPWTTKGTKTVSISLLVAPSADFQVKRQIAARARLSA